MNARIRLFINHHSSRNLAHNNFYTIKTRGTYYGIHKNTLLTNHINPYSKTSLLMFIEYKHARDFKNFLEYSQSDDISFERNIELDKDDSLCLFPTRVTSILPIHVNKIKSSTAELICLQNFFDMFIISNTKKTENSYDLFGYELITKEYPNREYMEYVLRHLI